MLRHSHAGAAQAKGTDSYLRQIGWREFAHHLLFHFPATTAAPLAFMHNRIRMIVASVLTKNLQIHWLQGARWFWETLVDANLANNTLGWQWVAGCGADAAPDLGDSRKRALQVYAQLRNQ